MTLIMTQLMNGVYWSAETCRPVIIDWSGGLSECRAAVLAAAQAGYFHAAAGVGQFLVRLIVAVLVMSAALLGMMHVMPEWSLGTMPYRLMRLMAVVCVGVVAYFATLAVLGFKVKEFARRTA